MLREIKGNDVCKISELSVTSLIFTSQHSDVTQWTRTVRDGQRPRLMLCGVSTACKAHNVHNAYKKVCKKCNLRMQENYTTNVAGVVDATAVLVIILC